MLKCRCKYSRREAALTDFLRDENACRIIKTLENSGESAYAVGGCVRDRLLGRVSNDIDIAASAKPETVMRLFGSCSVIGTGLKHGTVTVVMGGVPYEVTTFRTDGEYADSRHPQSVRFVGDIETDLARRDFTVNAIAYSPARGIVDPFCGADDIKKGIIRAVGDPAGRFSEDALRILRAFRFASVLGFEVEPETASAAYKLRDTLSAISAERVFSELKKLLCGAAAYDVICRYREIIAVRCPLAADIPDIGRLPEDAAMRFAAVCGAEAGAVLYALKADKETRTRAERFSLSHPFPADERGFRAEIARLGVENAKDIAAYRDPLYGEHSAARINALIESGACLSLNELAVNGADVCALGARGADIGAVLNELLFAAAAGDIANKREVLLHDAKVIVDKRKK